MGSIGDLEAHLAQLPEEAAGFVHGQGAQFGDDIAGFTRGEWSAEFCIVTSFRVLTSDLA